MYTHCVVISNGIQSYYAFAAVLHAGLHTQTHTYSRAHTHTHIHVCRDGGIPAEFKPRHGGLFFTFQAITLAKCINPYPISPAMDRI